MKDYGKVCTIRLPSELLDEIEAAIASRRAWSARGHWYWRYSGSHEHGRTAWIIRAIKEKLAKLVRGRRKRSKPLAEDGAIA